MRRVTMFQLACCDVVVSDVSDVFTVWNLTHACEKKEKQRKQMNDQQNQMWSPLGNSDPLCFM